MGDFDNLCAPLHRARTCNHQEVSATHQLIAQVESGVFGVVFAAGNFVGMGDSQYFRNAFHHPQLVFVDGRTTTNHADNGAFFAFREVNIVTHSTDTGNHIGNLTGGGVGGHNDNHGVWSAPCVV